MNPDLLIVCCKLPASGDTARRLTPPLTPEQGRAACVAMIMDTQATVSALPGVDTWYAWAGEPSPALRASLPACARIVDTPGDDPGERVSSAFRAGFDIGYRRVAVISSDSPDLPAAYIRAAFTRLRDEPDLAVLGPARDGGCYLAALSLPRPQLFFGVPWGTNRTLEVMQSIAKRYAIPVALLPEWQDVDTWQDLYDCLTRNGAPHLRAIHDAGLLRPAASP